MVVKRLAACVVLLMLAGCYRQSEDNFGPSSGQSQTTPLVQATDQLPTIDPTTQETITDETPLAPLDITPTVMIIVPTDEGNTSAEPTATIVIIEPPRATPTNEENLLSTLPTATVPAAVITPLLGNPAQITLNAPTSTTTAPLTTLDQPTPGGSALEPTPTDLPTETSGECDYTIEGGDTLFRIALRNDVSLEQLLLANELSESSIIQPGQVITIPDCVTEENPETIIATATPGTGIFLPTSTGVSVSNGTPGTPGTSGTGEVYTVKPGDTLSVIAAQFDVSVQSIVDANNLTNPNRLSIGQKLTIPK